MLDIHCHVAYGCDDGAESLEAALTMIELAAKCGTKGIAVTPHSNIPGSYENFFRDGISDKISTLRRLTKEKGLGIQLFSGQEIFLTDNVIPLLESGKLITLNGSKYPLVEFDFAERQESAILKLKRLVAAGYIPVVAHPERYGFVIEDDSAPLMLKSIGCVLQINKGSIEGHFGEMPLRTVRNMLKHRLADVAASDAHGPHIRTPDMRNAYEKVSSEYSPDYAQLLFKENPENVLRNRRTNGF